MNPIKSYREQRGMTQKSLAKSTGLSLRTIQRIESGKSELKGHSLSVLADYFDIEAADLKNSYRPNEAARADEKTSLLFINLSALGLLVLPLANLIFPYLLWKRNRHVEVIDMGGRRILNFQLIWTILLFISLIVAPFIDNEQFTIPLILIVLISMIGLNIVVIFHTASQIQKREFDVLNLPLKLI